MVSACAPGRHYDNDHNGYVNDIAGWNFFDNDNDPTDRSSYFAAAQPRHRPRRRRGRAAATTAQGSIGVCPHCQFMPVRMWDTFVSDGNTFALGITYATDNGAKVIEGANGSLYHSAFAEAATQYAYDHGVVQTYSGDDLNTANHNYPADYGHAMLIQGTVPDTVGLGTEQAQWLQARAAVHGVIEPAGRAPARTCRSRPSSAAPNTTQFGGKSSISMEGATGSVNTGRPPARPAWFSAPASTTAITLRPDETRELLEQTAEEVLERQHDRRRRARPRAPTQRAAADAVDAHFG